MAKTADRGSIRAIVQEINFEKSFNYKFVVAGVDRDSEAVCIIGEFYLVQGE